MERWNGALEWTTGMEHWSVLLLLFLATNKYHFSFCSLLSELYINFRVYNYMFLYNY